MLDKVFDILKTELLAYLTLLPELNISGGDKVKVSRFVKDDGTIAIPNDTLGLTLVNVEEERIMKSQITHVTTPKGTVANINPEIKLNLYVLFAANFADYSSSLKFLSGVFRFFQSKTVFTSDNTPIMDPTIQKLIVELYSLSFEQQNHLWGYLGAKFIPSVLYKIRLVTIQECAVSDETPRLGVLDYGEQGI